MPVDTSRETYGKLGYIAPKNAHYLENSDNLGPNLPSGETVISVSILRKKGPEINLKRTLRISC